MGVKGDIFIRHVCFHFWVQYNAPTADFRKIKKRSPKSPTKPWGCIPVLTASIATPTGVSTGMHPQGEWGLSSEFFLDLKSAVDALYCTQKRKQTCRMKKSPFTHMHFLVMQAGEISLCPNAAD